MTKDIYILIGFGLLLLYIVYSYNKNKSVYKIDIDDDNEYFTDDLDYDNKIEHDNLLKDSLSYLINKKTGVNKFGCKCKCHIKDSNIKHIEPCCGPNKSKNNKYIDDIFPTGKSFLINPNTGLNKYGCNCICHEGIEFIHLAPCCGIKEVCGCPCHLGIEIDHNNKCCDSIIV